MRYKIFGNTNLKISVIGFGAWGIGGPAKVGDIAIGWGDVDDRESVKALKKSMDLGINFYDTADFYGRGHSEELIGKTFGNRDDVIIASKAGHRVDENQNIFTDYSSEYIRSAVEASLKRLKRDAIDFFQLHTAKKQDLENPLLTQELDKLVEEGKIRYYGVSLNTFEPDPEGDYVLENNWGSGMQVVFNLINQKCRPIINESNKIGQGIIARMPLQFGILTGKFDEKSSFDKNDHRNFRLPGTLIKKMNKSLEDVWTIASEMGISNAELSLRYIISTTGVSTVIPGIKTVAQAEQNGGAFELLPAEIMERLNTIYDEKLSRLWKDIVAAG